MTDEPGAAEPQPNTEKKRRDAETAEEKPPTGEDNATVWERRLISTVALARGDTVVKRIETVSKRFQ